MRTIYLPAIERRITLGQYITAVRTAIANPDVEYHQGLTTWWPTTGREIRKQFVRGLFDRINQGIPYNQRGMK